MHGYEHTIDTIENRCLYRTSKIILGLSVRSLLIFLNTMHNFDSYIYVGTRGLEQLNITDFDSG